MTRTTNTGRTLLTTSLIAGALALGCGGGAGKDPGNAPGTNPGNGTPTQVSAPTFSPDGGTFNAATSVTLSSATPGATIRYTTDGSTPSATAGDVFAAPFSVAATATIRAVAYKAGMADSAVVERSFAINVALQQVAAPSFSPDGGSFSTAASVSLATTTPGASIRYTTDGRAPSASAGTLYSGPFTVSATATVRAIACKDGMADSAVVERAFTISVPPQQVAAPTFSPDGGTFSAATSVSLATTTPGASIRYTTDGTTPSSSVGTLYSGSFTVSTTATVRAIAYKDGMTDSFVAASAFTIASGPPQVAAPRFSPNGGAMTGKTLVSLTSDTPGATIRYTYDGTTMPSATVGSTYYQAFYVSSTMLLRAVAYKAGMATSSVTEALFAFENTAPTFNAPAGTYSQPVIVTLSSSTGSSFRYTTDGTTPTVSTGAYDYFQQSFPIASTTTLKAITYSPGAGVDPSDVATAQYTITKAAPPIFSVGGGTSDHPASVIISSVTPGAAIRYTKDGTTPTTSSGTVYDGNPVPLTASEVRFRAIAYMSGMDASDVVEVALSSGARFPPVFTAGALSSRILQLEQGQSVALMLYNGGANTGNLLVQGYVVQGSTRGAAGGMQLACRPDPSSYENFVRAGTACSWSFSVVARSSSGNRAGAGTARFELQDSATYKTYAAYEVPVTVQ